MVTLSARSTFIEGVPRLTWCNLKDTTFIGALEAATAPTAHPFDYATLMGMTGLAFRLRWFRPAKPGTFVAYSAMGDGPEIIAAARLATGWQLRAVGSPEEQIAHFLPELLNTLDRGLPVLGYRRFQNLWDTGVVVGYEDGGSTLLAHDYFAGEHVPLRLTLGELHPFLIFLGERRKPPEPYTVLVRSLIQTVRDWYRDDAPANALWHWRRFAANDRMAYGDTAYGAWLDALAGANELTPAERESLFHASWYHYDVMYGARASAERYLRTHASLLVGRARDAVEHAAVLYGDERGLLQRAWDRQDAFLGPWTNRHDVAEWSDTVIRRERAILNEARAIEHAAIKCLERALTAVGVSL